MSAAADPPQVPIPEDRGPSKAQKYAEALQGELDEAVRNVALELERLCLQALADIEEESRFVLEDAAWRVLEEMEKFAASDADDAASTGPGSSGGGP